jgi:hypothetical protein
VSAQPIVSTDPHGGVTVLPAFYNEEGDAFTAIVTPGGCPGYCITHRTGEVNYVYLNASGSDEDGRACVFLYIGPNGDPSSDGAAHFYDISPTEEPEEWPTLGTQTSCANCDLDVEWHGEDWLDRGSNTRCASGEYHEGRKPS